MNRIPMLFILLGALLPVCTEGQIVYKESVKRQGQFNDFTMIPVGDSTLFCYSEVVRGSRTKRSRWVGPDWTSREDVIPFDVLSIMRFDDEIYYYYFKEENEKAVLAASMEKVGTHIRRDILASIAIPPGILMGVYRDANLNFLVYNSEQNQIVLTKLIGLQILKQQTYALPFPLSKVLKKPQDVFVFEGNSSLNGLRGHVPVKVFNYDKIYISADINTSNAPQGVKGTTEMLILDPDSDELQRVTIREEEEGRFISCILENKLFRSNISGRSFVLSVYDITTGMRLSRVELNKNKDHFHVYVRRGRENTVVSTGTSKIMMSGAGVGSSPSLGVFKDNDRYFLQWGTYYDKNPVFASAGPGLIQALIKSLVVTTIMQLQEPPGIHQYFYYEFNGTDSTLKKVEDSVPLVRRNIDNFEMQTEKERKFHFKSYVPYKNGVLAAYYFIKDAEINLVYFE